MNKFLLFPLIAVILISGCAQKVQPSAQPSAGETVQPEKAQQEGGLAEQEARGSGESTEQTPTKRFSLDVDENGFYPTKRIAVPKGEIVGITFFVKPGVSLAGLTIKSDYFDSGVILPDHTGYVQFTATDSFEFTAYQSNTNIAKATGQVLVI